MSHRDEPRSGRGCFAAVVVVPFLALGGMFMLIALTGSPDESPQAAPNTPRPARTSQWWTEPFETSSTATITETVVLEGQQRELKAARLATQARVSTVTETVRSTVAVAKPPATGRNEPPAPQPSEEEPADPTVPSTSDSAAPTATTGVEVPPSPPLTETPSNPPTTDPEVPVTTTPPCPRSEDPVTPTPTSTPQSERSEPAPSLPEEPSVSVEATIDLPLPTDTPAEEPSALSAPAAGA